MITKKEFADRRAQLAAQLLPGSVAIISAAPHPCRTYETEYPYRQDSDFYYLTGFSEPHAVAVITSEGQFTLFNQPLDLLVETWTGPLAGQEGAVRDVGADESFPYDDFFKRLPSLIKHRKAVYYVFNYDIELQRELLKTLDSMQYKVRMGVDRPSSLFNLQIILHEMRLIKSAAEIELMAKACDISSRAHKRCMQAIKSGLYEYSMEAEFMHEILSHGARFTAYNNIIAAGANACTLHYNANNAVIKDGDLLLMDAGAEWQCYASDITRTYPASGRYSDEQKALYDVVLNTQMSCIDLAKPGVTHADIEAHAQRLLTEGLVSLGILRGNIDTLVEEKAFKPFYMHRIGHWLGLDVHDRGSYFVNDVSRALQPNMTMTIEPGLYISPRAEGVDKKWRGIGIRIEDNIVITEKGNRVLSAATPKTIADIESLMAAS